MGGRRKRSRWRAQINISAGVGHPAYSLRPCLHLADLLLSSPPCITIPGQHSFFSLLTPPLLPPPLRPLFLLIGFHPHFHITAIVNLSYDHHLLPSSGL